MKAISLRINLANKVATQNNTVRMVLVKDKQPNIAAAAWTDVFTTASITSHRTIPYIDRFDILMDKTFSINNENDTSLQQLFLKKYKKIFQGESLVTFPDNSTTVPATNNYLLMYMGSTVSGANDVSVVAETRSFFTG